MTVSRVINDSPRVNDGTRRRVEAAIAELGYVPSRLARGFESGAPVPWSRFECRSFVAGQDSNNANRASHSRGMRDRRSKRQRRIVEVRRNHCDVAFEPRVGGVYGYSLYS